MEYVSGGVGLGTARGELIFVPEFLAAAVWLVTLYSLPGEETMVGEEVCEE